MKTCWKLSASKLLVVCAASLAATQSVQAQETANWEGLYVGANLGVFSGDNELSTSTDFCGGFAVNNCYFAANSIDLINGAGHQQADSNGFAGGLQAGYNFQVDNFVFGIETDFNAFKQNKSVISGGTYTNVTPGYPFQFNQSFESDWLATFRPRAGIAFDNALIYVTGGLALTKLDSQMNFEDFPNPSFSKASVHLANSDLTAGWTAGAGAEVKLDDNWSIKGEYLFTQFKVSGSTNNGSYVFVNNAGQTVGSPILVPNQVFKSAVKLGTHLFKVGVNYSF